MNYYLDVLKHRYASFEGRARRREFWWFTLVNFVVFCALSVVDGFLGTYDEQANIGLFGALYLLAMFIPALALTVRRLHDTNRSGWWVLLGLIPLLGALVLLYFEAQDSQPGGNRYGPNPKGVLGPGTPSPIVTRD